MSIDSARSSRAESDWSWNSFISAKALLRLSALDASTPSRRRMQLEDPLQDASCGFN
jgi:hypothetical protein